MAVDLFLLTRDTREAWLALKQRALEVHGFDLRERSGRRTCAEQAGLYAIGRGAGDTRAIVTKARGCLSWHVTGRAVDFDLYLPNGKKTFAQSDYALVGDLAKADGFKWGGDFPGFPDLGHVEYHPGMTIEQVCPDPGNCRDDAYTDTEPPPPDGEEDGESTEPSLWKTIGLALTGGVLVGVLLSLRK